MIGYTDSFRLGTVLKRDFQRFAIACGDHNPVYFDPEAARAAGYPDVIAPPIFLTGVMGWDAGPREEELRPDGVPKIDMMAVFSVPGARLMGGGQELEFVNPVLDGYDITVHRKVNDVEFRESKTGGLVLFHTERRYFNQHAQLLVICRETLIMR